MKTEREEFLTGGLVPVRCGSCDTTVLAGKRSPRHTSIQWLTDASATCPVLAEAAAAGTHAALLSSCANLRASIAAAAREGTFETLTDP